MNHVMQGIVEGEFSNNYVAGLLIALRMKGESVDELVGAANFLRAKSTKLDLDMLDLVDTCGTGGDGLHTFNISTTSSFVAAAAGVKIAKHGGRSVSSASGSIDVLESLGINVNIDAARLKKLTHPRSRPRRVSSRAVGSTKNSGNCVPDLVVVGSRSVAARRRAIRRARAAPDPR